MAELSADRYSKDRLFFFIDYEALRYHGAGTTTASLAPPAFRAGDLSSLLTLPTPIQLYNSQQLGPDGKPVPYANNQVPITNPVAIYLFSHPNAYPLPNNPTADPTGVYNNFIGPTGSFSQDRKSVV